MAPSLSKISVDANNSLSAGGYVSYLASIKPLNLGHTRKSEDLVLWKSILGTAVEDISTVHLLLVHFLPLVQSLLAMGMEGVARSAYLTVGIG